MEQSQSQSQLPQPPRHHDAHQHQKPERADQPLNMVLVYDVATPPSTEAREALAEWLQAAGCHVREDAEAGRTHIVSAAGTALASLEVFRLRDGEDGEEDDDNGCSYRARGQTEDGALLDLQEDDTVNSCVARGIQRILLYVPVELAPGALARLMRRWQTVQ